MNQHGISLVSSLYRPALGRWAGCHSFVILLQRHDATFCPNKMIARQYESSDGTS
jgi:hypothetical protein